MPYIKCPTEAMEYLCAHDEKLKDVIKRLGPIRRERTPDIFEALVSSLVSQQISTRAAQAIWQRLVEATGIQPNVLATMAEEELRALGLSGKKAQYVKGAAKAFVDGTLNQNELLAMGDEEVKSKLSTLYGVGIWTAEMLLIFSLGRMDVLSERDLGIVRGIRRVYGIENVTPEFVAELKRRVSPYGTVASLYLWAVAGEKL